MNKHKNSVSLVCRACGKKAKDGEHLRSVTVPNRRTAKLLSLLNQDENKPDHEKVCRGCLRKMQRPSYDIWRNFCLLKYARNVLRRYSLDPLGLSFSKGITSSGHRCAPLRKLKSPSKFSCPSLPRKLKLYPPIWLFCLQCDPHT